jgi:RND family efflux transporter MFP subunit
MKTQRVIILLLILALILGGVYYATRPASGEIVLTGIVTTDAVTVSPEIRGRLDQLLVKQGDKVEKGQLLAVIEPQEQIADLDFYKMSDQQYAAQTAQAQADLDYAKLTFERDQRLHDQHAVSEQDYDQARTNYDAAKARVEMMHKQNQAAAAQEQKAAVQLGYTRITAPVSGLVDTRVALQGEVVNIGQPIVTLIDPDDLWVRVDVETLDGTVFYRGVDADYATQRDVSRTKRDIKTFEVRLRCDNRDRRLAVGMTAFAALPIGNP